MLSATNNLFYSKKATLLSSSDENAYSDFLGLHNRIDKLFNDIDINDLKVRGYENAGLDEDKMKGLFNEIAKVPIKHKLIYSKFEQIKERISQLNVRLFYSNANLKKLEEHDKAWSENGFNSIKTDINNFLDGMKSVMLDLNYDDFNVINDIVGNLNINIDNFHKKIDNFNNEIERVIKRELEPKLTDIEEIKNRILNVKTRFGFNNKDKKFPHNTPNSGRASEIILEMKSYMNSTEEQKLELQHIHNMIDCAISLLEQQELEARGLKSTPINRSLFDDYYKFIDETYYHYLDGGRTAIPDHGSDDFLQVFSRRVDQLKNRIGYLSQQFCSAFNKETVEDFDKDLNEALNVALKKPVTTQKFAEVKRREDRRFKSLSSLANRLKSVLNFDKIFQGVKIAEDKKKDIEEKLENYKLTLNALRNKISEDKDKYFKKIENYIENYREYAKSEMEDLSRNAKSRFDLIVKDFNSMLSSLKGEKSGFSIEGLNKCGFRSMNNKIDNIHNSINSLQEDLNDLSAKHKTKDLNNKLNDLKYKGVVDDLDKVVLNSQFGPKKHLETLKTIFDKLKSMMTENNVKLEDKNNVILENNVLSKVIKDIETGIAKMEKPKKLCLSVIKEDEDEDKVDENKNENENKNKN